MPDYDVNTFNKSLKVIYPKGLSWNVYAKDDFLLWLPKSTDFVGKEHENTVVYEGTHGSADLSKARTNAGVTPFATFKYTRKRDYTVFYLDLEAMKASANNKGALASTVKTSMKGALNGCANTTLHQLWGNGGGARGRVSAGSTVGSVTISLDSKADIVHFGKGMVLQASPDDGTGGAGVRPGTITVLKINRQLGTLEAAANWNDAANIPALAVGDYLFRDGDYNMAINGVFAHCPPTEALAATSFLGVDRSQDTERLAGLRVDATGADTIDALIEAAAQHETAGGQSDTAFVNPLRFGEMAKEIHGKTVFRGETSPSKGVSIKTLEIFTSRGVIKVMKSRGCPYNRGLLSHRNNWDLKSLGGWPHVANEHGLNYITTDRDALEGRLKRYGDLICIDPKDNCNILFS